jgi:hypothetical protein
MQRLGMGELAVKIEDDRFRPAQGLDNCHPTPPGRELYRKCLGFSVEGSCFHWV